MAGMDTTVAIPAYNEEKCLRRTVENVEKELQRIKEVGSFDIIISEGGSKDSTPEIAEDLQEEFENVRYLDLGGRRGKGKAVEEAFHASDKKYFVFMDADGATAAGELEGMIKELEDSDVVAGSRENDEAEREFFRNLASNIFNYSVRALFFSDLCDHQCGFKGFRREAVKDLFNQVESKHWFWDTEFLVKAQERDMDVEVLSVEWEEKDDSEIDIISDGLYFSRKLAELRVKQWMS
jgi:glycosyltransferase involved in cell wall biosynthesis